MSVIDVRLIGERRQGSIGSRRIKTYIQLWRVQTNDPLDGPAVVLAASGLPQYYDEYDSGNDSDDRALCTLIEAQEEGEGFKSWIVTCTYSTGINAAEFDTENPLLDTPKYSLSFDQFTTVARRAIDHYAGTEGALVNVWGEAFRPGVEVDDCRGVYVVQKNEAFVQPALIISVVNTVNASPWKGCPPRTVKCKSIITGDIQQRNNISFYPTVYEFHLNQLTWDLKVLNQSTKYKDSNSKTITLAAGQDPVTIYTGNEGSSSQKYRKVPAGANLTGDGIYQIYMRYRYFQEIDFNSYFLF